MIAIGSGYSSWNAALDTLSHDAMTYSGAQA